MAKVNVYEMVTARMIEELEKGNIPWSKPWHGTRHGAFNRVSKRSYSILNQCLLKHEGEYASLKQWNSLGGKIRKGEKGEFVVFWKILRKTETGDDGEKREVTIPMLRYYNVFHISQVEGVEPLSESELGEVNPIPEADEIIHNYVAREGIKFEECITDEAYYAPMRDLVHVPAREQYSNANEYYSTTFHELVHSTGHKSRLNRLTEKAAFGNEVYSKEELVAEIGSAGILNLLGIETKGTFRNSTAYIQSWIKALKNDVKLVVSASSKADKAIEYILGEV